MSVRTERNYTVVLVDDDLELARGLERRCRRASVYFRPPALASAEWASSLEGADLVIWDWSKMASGDRRGIVQEVQTRHPDLPMLVLDISFNDDGAEEIVARPSTDFVRRPVDMEEVFHRVDRLLSSRGRLRAAPGARSRPVSPPGGATATVSEDRVLETPAGGVAKFEHLAVDLHNRESGRLDARRVSDVFGIPLRRIAALLGQKAQTVSKTPDSRALQPGLALFERIAAALIHLVGSEEGLRIWINAGNPALDGSTPIEFLLRGEGEVLADLLESMLVGQPG